MDAAARSVGRARLHVVHADDAPRLRFVLEDALRTAEFHDAGRLVLMRRLCLAGLAPRIGGPALARAIEAAWRRAASMARPATEPAAGDADVVWFASRSAARLAWLRAAVAGPAPKAWFWTAALPELVQPRGTDGARGTAPPAPVDADIEAVVAALWHDDPAAARQAWRQAGARAGAQAGAQAERAALGRHLPASEEASHEASSPMVPSGRPPPPSRQPMASAEDRAVAMSATGPVGGRGATPVRPGTAPTRPPAAGAGGARRSPQAAATAGPGARAPAAPRQRAAGASSAGPDAAAPAPGRDPASPGHEREPCAAGNQGRWLEPGPQPTQRHGRSAPAARAATPAALAPPTPAPNLRPGPWPWLGDAAFSGHGGLLFALNALKALRFDAWLAKRPDASAFVDALCLHLLDAGGAPADDPQRAWFEASACAGDPGLRLWRLRLRRWLRRRARTDLPSLLARPAWVSGSATHLDIVFALDAVDLRLRRIGLDIDPGWLPWFGRIVAFHFLPAGDLPAWPPEG